MEAVLLPMSIFLSDKLAVRCFSPMVTRSRMIG